MIKLFTNVTLLIFDHFHKRKIVNFLKKSNINSIDIFFDIGAHEGESIEFFSKYLQIKKIYSFEASLKNFKQLKKKYKNILTIIIPRHVERTPTIMSELSKLDLNICTHESKNKVHNNVDIYIIDSYGKTKSVYNFCKSVFLGGSLINHGGQNPLEATRYGCKVLHGPFIENFKEIYDYLEKLKLSSKVNNPSELSSKLENLFLKKNNSKLIQNKLGKIGDKILIKTYKEIYTLVKNEL